MTIFFCATRSVEYIYIHTYNIVFSVHTYINTYIHTYIHTYMLTNLHIYIPTCIHTCNIHIIYTHIYIFLTNIHIYIQYTVHTYKLTIIFALFPDHRELGGHHGDQGCHPRVVETHDIGDDELPIHTCTYIQTFIHTYITDNYYCTYLDVYVCMYALYIIVCIYGLVCMYVSMYA